MRPPSRNWTQKHIEELIDTRTRGPAGNGRRTTMKISNPTPETLRAAREIPGVTIPETAGDNDA